MKEIENDKKIIESIKGSTTELTILNTKLSSSKKGYLFQDKVFLSEDKAEEYIKEHMSELEDFYTKDMLDDLAIIHMEEIEEVEVIF